MRGRWPEWALALLLVGLTVLLVLRPAEPRPGELRLEVVSVRSLPRQEGTPQTVEVQVRWYWLHPPAAGSLSKAGTCWPSALIRADGACTGPPASPGWSRGCSTCWAIPPRCGPSPLIPAATGAFASLSRLARPDTPTGRLSSPCGCTTCTRPPAGSPFPTAPG